MRRTRRPPRFSLKAGDEALVWKVSSLTRRRGGRPQAGALGPSTSVPSDLARPHCPSFASPSRPPAFPWLSRDFPMRAALRPAHHACGPVCLWDVLSRGRSVPMSVCVKLPVHPPAVDVTLRPSRTPREHRGQVLSWLQLRQKDRAPPGPGWGGRLPAACSTGPSLSSM